MTKIKYFFAAVIFACLTLNAFAKKTEGQLYIVLGFGQVKVEARGLKEWTNKQSQQLETDLLIAEDLAPIVTGKSQVIVQIFQSELEHAMGASESFGDLEDLIMDRAVEAAKQEMGAGALDGDSATVIKGDDRVVVGSQMVVEEGEELEEVVVVAGSAEIKGRVKRLIVLGGTAHLYSTAEIVEELNVVGGRVVKDPGAKIMGKQVELSMPMSKQTWNLVFDSLDDTPMGEIFNSFWGQVAMLLVKILILMGFAFAGYWVAPGYQDKVLGFLSSRPIASMGWGVLSGLLVLPVTVMLCVSIIGIPLLPLQFSLIVLFVIFGYIHVGQAVLRWGLKKLQSQIIVNPWVIMFLGILCLQFLERVPGVGDWLTLFLGLAGFGAASHVFYSLMFSKKAKAESLQSV